MKKYINEISHLIEVQIKQAQDVAIIRLDGMESPYLYKEICKNFNKNSKYDLKAKLSKIRYDEFLKQDNDEWINDLKYLRENDFIDLDDAMTRWRNNATESISDKKQVVFLMGTEVVEDKGGIEDFYCINPETILRIIKKDYSSWFNEILIDIGEEKENKNAINTIFKVIFSDANINLLSLSSLIEVLEGKNLRSIDELLEEICFSLREYWDIPMIRITKKNFKIAALKSGKITGANIIKNAYGFINRVKFNKGISKKDLATYEKRIDEYRIAKDFNLESKFPLEDPIFNTYDEFKNDLIDFIVGKRYNELRAKFMRMDYSIIEEVLKFKLDGKTIIKNETEKKVIGEPIEAFIEIILDSIFEFNKEKKELPADLEFEINEILITNCTSEEESKEEYLHNIFVNLKGLLEFLAIKNNDLDLINIRYKDNISPLINDAKLLTVKTKASLTELCKIKISVKTIREDIVKKTKYVFAFENSNSWINDFIFVNKYKDRIPFYSKILNKQRIITCESEESFFSNIEKLTIDDKYNVKYKNFLENIEDDNFKNSFANLELNYREFLETLNTEGLYGSFLDGNICKVMFGRYTALFEYIVDKYKTLDSREKDQMKILLDMFTLADKNFTENRDLIIIPPYHPVMLEKIYYKAEYLKESMYQIIEAINKGDLLSKSDVEKRINNDFKMVYINTAMDIITLDKNHVISSKICCGKYTMYIKKNQDSSMIKIEEVLGNVLDDNTKELVEIVNNKKSYKSDIICQNIFDYIKTFPARTDGLNLLFVNPEDIQHIVTGVYSAINIIGDKYGNLSLNLHFIVDSGRASVSNYLKLWLSKYFDENENINIEAFVTRIDLKEEDKSLVLEAKNLKNYDITYIYNVLEDNNIEFLKVQHNFENNKNKYKYPAIYKPMPVSLSQDDRSVDISQKQFFSNKAYVDLVHNVTQPNAIDGIYRTIKKVSISENKRNFLVKIHEKSKWVVCLDETIDKNIINFDDSKIIGFSTGKGLFGELNITVSAREDIIEDIKEKLNVRLKQRFTRWENEIVKKATETCIDVSKNLDGSKLLKALNPMDYEIHNYLAYVLTMQYLNTKNSDSIIRVLINLDNYIHWFDESLSEKYLNEDGEWEENSSCRPDFLILEVDKKSLIENTLKINAQVIECKMGNQNEMYIEKAKKQVVAGIKKLGANFNRDNNSTRRRYWFNQLYRALVFSRLELNDNTEEYKLLMDKLDGIYEGDFEITWSGEIFAYWLNVDGDKLLDYDFTDFINIELGENKLFLKEFKVREVGQIAVQKALLKNYENKDNMIVFEEEVILEQEDIKRNLDVLDTEILNDEDNTKLELFPNNKIIEVEEKIVNEFNEEEITNKSNDEEIKIEEILVKENQEEIFSKTPIKELKNTKEHIRFLLGEDVRTKEKIYWEYTHKDLNNRHLLINGNSGSGKTYCIQTLILEAVKNNISVIVFDYTDGFTETKLSPILVKQLGDKFEGRFVKYDKFPINPFKKGTQILPGGREVQELETDIANRIANSFTNVYGFGDQQRSAIYSSVKNALKEFGDNMTLEDLRTKLKESDNQSSKTVLSKIEALFDYEPFLSDSDFSWKDIVEDKGKMYVIQLSGYDREIQVILTELILWDIWNYALKNGDESTPMPLVLDEAQNLAHGENSPSGKILAEGRKFGLSGWYATQFMAGRLSAGEIGNLQQAAQKLYFSPPEKSINEVAKYIDISSDGSKNWAEKLPKLIKGECVTAGFRVRNGKIDKYVPRIIKVTSLEERINDEF